MTRAVQEPFPVSYGNQEYNLRRFLRNHPGGANSLESYRNKSVVEGMGKYGHSAAAFHLMEDYKLEDNNNLNSEHDSKFRNGHFVNGKEGSADNALLKQINGKVDNSYLNGSVIKEDNQRKEKEKENEELREIENLVDWSQPMIPQLAKLGSNYERWVNSPVDRQLRLFASPMLESLTFCPWYFVPAFWLPIISYLSYGQYTTHVICTDKCPDDAQVMTHLWFLTYLAVGVLAWTLLEYSIHRWIFHLDPGSSPTFQTLHFVLHGLHHKVPFDSLRLVFPPIPAAAISLFIYHSIARPLFQFPLIVTTGGLIGYLTYDMIHAYIHNGSPEDGTYMYEMKRYHANHHFINYDKGFGISNKLWDHIFQTKIHLRRLGFSLKW